jgi:hypothetical protein
MLLREPDIERSALLSLHLQWRAGSGALGKGRAMTWRVFGSFLASVVLVSTALVITQLAWGRRRELGLLCVAVPAGVVVGSIVGYREQSRLRRNGIGS